MMLNSFQYQQNTRSYMTRKETDSVNTPHRANFIHTFLQTQHQALQHSLTNHAYIQQTIIKHNFALSSHCFCKYGDFFAFVTDFLTVPEPFFPFVADYAYLFYFFPSFSRFFSTSLIAPLTSLTFLLLPRLSSYQIQTLLRIYKIYTHK